MSDVCGHTDEPDHLDLPIILYGIKQVSIDPNGFLRLKRQADEHESLHTARLYAAIYERFDWAALELVAIAEELCEHDGWRAFAEIEVAQVQALMPALAELAPDLLLSAFAHGYVCGTFASAYPDRLFQLFPSTAHLHERFVTAHGEDTSADIVAMQLALVDLLMVPNEAGWQALVDRN